MSTAWSRLLGGVGKTRLALRVAADMSDRFADGVWYVDLVPVTDTLMIAPAIADVLGLGERQGSSAADNVLSWLADREALLVLDNCEHLLDGVVVLLERLLAGSPRLVALATSRARLLVPFERVFPVSGLSVEADDGGPADAVELFLGRAAAGGTPVRSGDLERIAGICRALDGMALAIELAAARYPSLGLDGARWARNWVVRSVAAAERRPADRRPAPFVALDARLELCTAGRTRAGGAASGLGFRRPVHRDRSGGGSGRLAASAGRSCPHHPGRARRPEFADRDRGAERDPLPSLGNHPPVRRRSA
jgi:hypothetical protein